MATNEPPQRVGILCRLQSGEAQAKDRRRLQPVIDALQLVGVSGEFVGFDEAVAERVRQQLLGLDGVLVWVDPIVGERDRSLLDDLLRDVAKRGVWISAHPDVILKMGTKEVLFEARALPFGSETDLYRTWGELRARFPKRLAGGAPRVLKRHRGNAGIGVWKVTAVSTDAPETDRAIVEVQDAHPRGVTVETLLLSDFMTRCVEYFAGSGFLLDQPFQPRVSDGLVRCYLVKDRIVGFSTQQPDEAQLESGRVFGLPAAKTMYDAEAGRFSGLKQQVEKEWLPPLQHLLNVDTHALPVLWDADFLYGPKDADGNDSYVLCEINMSCVTPFPDSAPAAIAEAVRGRLGTSAPGR